MCAVLSYETGVLVYALLNSEPQQGKTFEVDGKYGALAKSVKAYVDRKNNIVNPTQLFICMSEIYAEDENTSVTLIAIDRARAPHVTRLIETVAKKLIPYRLTKMNHVEMKFTGLPADALVPAFDSSKYIVMMN